MTGHNRRSQPSAGPPGRALEVKMILPALTEASWAIDQGIETATFHILTPYPGTALYRRMESEGRILHRNWDLYDTRHVVFHTRAMPAGDLEAGYRRAYRDFYLWGSILRGASRKGTWSGRLRHAAYAAGWKKFEPLWDLVIRGRRVCRMLPILEAVLGCESPVRAFGSTRRPPSGLRAGVPAAG